MFRKLETDTEDILWACLSHLPSHWLNREGRWTVGGDPHALNLSGPDIGRSSSAELPAHSLPE